MKLKYEIADGKGTTPTEATDRLRHAVKGMIEYGWEPQGGMTIVEHRTGTFYAYQAMTIKAVS